MSRLKSSFAAADSAHVSREKRHQPEAGGDAGFTLIELLVVMVISAVLMSLTASGWASYQRKAELRQSVDEVVSALRNAQQAAFAEARTYCVQFTTASSTYVVRPGGCASAVVGGTKAMRSRRVVLSQPSFVQPDGTTAAQVQFTPRGSATKGSLKLARTSSGGRTYTVNVEGLTARVSVS